MPEQLIATAGLWYLAACIAVFVAMFIEQAGAARSPEEDSERKRAVMLVLLLATFATVGLLLLHGIFLAAEDEGIRFAILAAPIGAMMLGSLFGAIFGAVARGAAPTMRKLALPLVLVALALTLYAAAPTIVALANSVLASP
jgi:hypothetical protein